MTVEFRTWAGSAATLTWHPGRVSPALSWATRSLALAPVQRREDWVPNLLRIDDPGSAAPLSGMRQRRTARSRSATLPHLEIARVVPARDACAAVRSATP